MKNFSKIATEIYLVFHKFNGSISRISGRLGRNDSTKLSRQINPNDDQRDNFYIELLEVHREMAAENPEMEQEIWTILERSRCEFRKDSNCRSVEIADRFKRVSDEFSEAMHKRMANAPREELLKEVHDLVPAVRDLVESVIGSDVMSREEIQQNYIGNN